MNNDLTVIIPSYNRLSILRLCLKSLEHQTYKNFEVIIVDDGSKDEVVNALREIERTSSLSLRVLYQENAGPARARNIAISHVSTHLSFLIGDDILPGPDCIEAHRDFHNVRLAKEEVALGWTQWDEIHQEVTPFMAWYEEIQFDYARLRSGLTPTFYHFYTSNLSFKTSLLQENPFDERFKAAGWEDIELGYRLLMSSQARLTFLESARATHIHPTTFLQATRRMQILGQNECFFHQLWPAARALTRLDLKARLCKTLALHLNTLNKVTGLVANSKIWKKPTRIHAMLLRSHQQYGYLTSCAEVSEVTLQSRKL